MPIEFRAYFIYPNGRRTGSLGVHPDDQQRLDDWRAANGHVADWLYVTHPTLGRLNAFRPVENQLLQRIVNGGIQDGQLCVVRYETQVRGGQVQMVFEDIRPA